MFLQNLENRFGGREGTATASSSRERPVEDPVSQWSAWYLREEDLRSMPIFWRMNVSIFWKGSLRSRWGEREWMSVQGDSFTRHAEFPTLTAIREQPMPK